MLTSSEYINSERRSFAIYVLQSRAIQSITDGLKVSARRVLWTARDGKKYKSATLAGACMSIHPHASPEGTINTLAAPYGNNICLLKGDGAFGTLLNPTAYGASRYTKCSVSEFSKDVLFKDIEIIPMIDNYDQTEKEPKHFLPLIPISLLNSQEGIAVGFASKILPRALDDIITDQVNHLKDKKIKECSPKFIPTNSVGEKLNDKQYQFHGSFERVDKSTIRITNLPYGVLHSKYVEKTLISLEDSEIIEEFVDQSRNKYDIIVKFKAITLKTKTDEQLIDVLELKSSITENMTLVDFQHDSIMITDYCDVIKKFTDWRLSWYTKRYERLSDLLAIDIQRYKDILLAIKKKIHTIVSKISSKDELKEFLKTIGVKNIEYIADLPIYRFTVEEKVKIENKLKIAEENMIEYQNIINSDEAKKKIYIDELTEVSRKYKMKV